jgi:DNA-directed RNA polymerase subunit N (RpoN/RPB10)
VRGSPSRFPIRIVSAGQLVSKPHYSFYFTVNTGKAKEYNLGELCILSEAGG